MKKTVFFLTLALMLTVLCEIKGQSICCNFPVTNLSSCDVYIGYDAYNSMCQVCDFGAKVLVPAGLTINIGTACCPTNIQDIIVALNVVDNCDVPGAQVGDQDPCEVVGNQASNSTTCAATDPHLGHPCNCPGLYTISYSASCGVLIQ